MWPWQRRSKFAQLHLPHKVFISHSYKDAEARRLLLASLPKNVEPFIFPPITVSPEQMVSNALIDAILNHRGLIYLQGGESEKSFWVAFERDYALRAGKPVFAYDPQTGTLHRDTSQPLSLSVFFSHSHQDNRQVMRIHDIMRYQRFFDTVIDKSPVFVPVSFTAWARETIRRQVDRGGYVILFWSREASNSGWVKADLRIALYGYRPYVLAALLDKTPLPSDLSAMETVQLYGDANRSFNQRIDDLIVRLYWLIYRNTRKNQLS